MIGGVVVIARAERGVALQQGAVESQLFVELTRQRVATEAVAQAVEQLEQRHGGVAPRTRPTA